MLIRRFLHDFINGSVKKKYVARKLVGYSAEQMYNVVADVKNYYKFVPFCTNSLIISTAPGNINARLDIGFPPIIESYTSRVTLVHPKFVKAVCKDGILFTALETKWKFSPGLKSNPQSCIVDFYINFEFKSSFYNHIAGLFFNKLIETMEEAFITEVKKRYGKESIPTHSLQSSESPKETL